MKSDRRHEVRPAASHRIGRGESHKCLAAKPPNMWGRRNEKQQRTGHNHKTKAAIEKDGHVGPCAKCMSLSDGEGKAVGPREACRHAAIAWKIFEGIENIVRAFRVYVRCQKRVENKEQRRRGGGQHRELAGGCVQTLTRTTTTTRAGCTRVAEIGVKNSGQKRGRNKKDAIKSDAHPLFVRHSQIGHFH
jgi:hypothetical protein